VQNRRGIYLYNKRSVRLPMLSAFDQPDAITSCPVRPESTHALQALTLFNSDFMQEVSQAFAERLQQDCGRDRGCQIDSAWRRALARPPRPQEARLAQTFFKSGRPLPDFCLALFNRNDFIYFLCPGAFLSYSPCRDASRCAGSRRSRIRICGTRVAAAASRTSGGSREPTRRKAAALSWE